MCRDPWPERLRCWERPGGAGQLRLRQGQALDSSGLFPIVGLNPWQGTVRAGTLNVIWEKSIWRALGAWISKHWGSQTPGLLWICSPHLWQCWREPYSVSAFCPWLNGKDKWSVYRRKVPNCDAEIIAKNIWRRFLNLLFQIILTTDGLWLLMN